MTPNATRTIEKVGQRLKELVDFPGRWAVRGSRVQHSYINDDHDQVFEGTVNMLFRLNQMQVFFDNLDKIEKLQQQELKIERLRSESTEFDALMQMVELTLAMSD